MQKVDELTDAMDEYQATREAFVRARRRVLVELGYLAPRDEPADDAPRYF